MLSTIVSGSLSSSLAHSGVLSVIMVVLCALLIVIQLAQIDVAARVLESIVKAFDSDAAAAVDTCLFIKFLVSISLLSTFHSTHVGVLVSKIVDIHQKISQCSRGVGPSGNGSAGRTSSNSRGNGNKRSKGSKDDGSAPPPPPPPPPSRPPPPPKNGKDANEINKAIVTVFVHVKAVLGHLKQVYKLSRPTKTRSRMEVNHLMLLWLYELRFETSKVAKAVGLSVNHKREPKYLFDYGIGEMYGLLEKILKYEDLVKRDICRCGSARDVEMMERRFEEEVVYRPIQELRDAVTLMMGCLKVMQEDREKGKRAKESEKVKPEIEPIVQKVSKEIAALAPVREATPFLTPKSPFRELSPFSPSPTSTAPSPALSNHSLDASRNHWKYLAVEDPSMREASFRTAAESFEEMITEIEIPDEEDLSRVDVSGFDLGAVMLSSTPAPWDKLPREEGSIDSPLAREPLSPRPSLPRSPGYSWKFPSDFRERVDALLGDRPLGKWVLGNDSPNSQSSNAGSSPSARDSGSSIGSAKCIIAASQDRDGRAWQIEITVDESDNSGDQGFQDDFVHNNSVSVFVTSPKDSTLTKEKRQGMVFPEGFSPPSFRGQEESPISSTPKGLEYSPNDSSAYSPSGDENLLLPPSQEFIEEHRSMMDETRKRAVERSMKVFYGRSIKAAVVPGTPDLNLPQELTMSPATPITPTPVGLILGPSNQGSLKPINSRIGRPSLPGGQMGRLGAGPKARVSTTPCPPPRVSGPSAPVGKPAPLRRPQPPSARIAPVPNAKVPTARPPPLRSLNSKPVTSKPGSNKMSPRKSIATAAQRDSIQGRSSSRNGSVPSKAPQQLATRENLIPVAKGRQSLSMGPTAMGSGRQIRRVASAATGVSRKI